MVDAQKILIQERLTTPGSFNLTLAQTKERVEFKVKNLEFRKSAEQPLLFKGELKDDCQALGRNCPKLRLRREALWTTVALCHLRSILSLKQEALLFVEG